MAGTWSRMTWMVSWPAFLPGLARSPRFEAALVARRIPCYLADARVAGPPIRDALIHFDKKTGWRSDSSDGYRRGRMASAIEHQRCGSENGFELLL